MRRALLVLAIVLVALPAEASWPPPPDVTRDQIAMPSFWPNDPDYPNQWEHWSWVPQTNQMLPGFRTMEAAMGAGNNTDRAWGISTGDPHVLISVIDCGIRWDEADLQLQAALNIGELPMPMGASSYDANGDGVINVADYLDDPRVPCGTAMPHPLRGCMDAGGMPNDPNHNGVFDAGDLIRVFSDGVDDDHNGYTDDIAGWDFFHDDNDPADDTSFGHGTGEARWSNAAGNDMRGSIGGCPNCQFMLLRAADSFIGEVDDAAQAFVYATDADYGPAPDGVHRRVHVIQIAEGTLDNSTFTMQAADYAYAHGVLVVASMADENSRHHNMPSTNNHTMTVHAIRYNNMTLQSSTTFLSYNNCTNYGGELQLSVSGTGCSSEATGQSSGVAGLIYSAGLQMHVTPPLSAEEVRQLFIETVDDIDIPESQPMNPNWDSTLYPSLPGWDQRFGYGRINARTALEWLRDGKIPPEVDIVSPRWFTSMFTDRPEGQHLRLEGTIAARRAPSFDYTIEWAPGIEPADTDWQPIRHEANVTAPVTNMLADLDLTTLHIDNPGEIENRFTITVRIRAVAHYGGTAGDVPGETRRVFYVLQDPDLLPGFPVDLRSSGESSPHDADLNGDGRREIVVATADGLVHAIQSDGTELAGFPVHTNLELGFDPARTPSYLNAPAFSGPTPAIDPTHVFEPVIATVAVGDLDGNGSLEIVAASYHGTVYVWNHDGTAWGHGFPYTLPDVPSSATDPTHILARGIFGSPVLVDLDHDGKLEIVFGAFDGNLYALDAMTGAPHHGYPVLIHFPDPPGLPSPTEHNRVFGSVGVGHFDSDTIPDLVVVSNEKLSGDRNTGAIYLVHGDGNDHPGGPFHPYWPVAITSINFFPLIGEGVSSSPAIADLDGDGLDDLSMTGSGNPTIILAHGVQSMPEGIGGNALDLSRIAVLMSSQRGALSDASLGIVSFINAFSLGSFGDLNADGTPDFVMTGTTLNLALNLAGGGKRTPFEHEAGAWDGRTGQTLPGFPRVIEDYTFFENPAIADLSGDGYPETILGTGGYYVRAFDACGREAPGFPKFTGQWVIPSPAVGDLDGDANHGLEVAVGTRSGYLYAWHTHGTATGSVQWPTFRHDNANTGNYGTTLDFGIRHVDGLATLACPTPPRPDAGVTDASDASTGADVISEGRGGAGGCGCRTVAGSRPLGVFAWVALTFGMALVRRRRRTRGQY